MIIENLNIVKAFENINYTTLTITQLTIIL